MSIYHKRNK